MGNNIKGSAKSQIQPQTVRIIKFCVRGSPGPVLSSIIFILNTIILSCMYLAKCVLLFCVINTENRIGNKDMLLNNSSALESAGSGKVKENHLQCSWQDIYPVSIFLFCLHQLPRVGSIFLHLTLALLHPKADTTLEYQCKCILCNFSSMVSATHWTFESCGMLEWFGPDSELSHQKVHYPIHPDTYMLAQLQEKSQDLWSSCTSQATPFNYHRISVTTIDPWFGIEPVP